MSRVKINSKFDDDFRFISLSPLGIPDVRLAKAWCDQGFASILTVDDDNLSSLLSRIDGVFTQEHRVGVRVPLTVTFEERHKLFTSNMRQPDVLVIDSTQEVNKWVNQHLCIVEVVSLDEAILAVESGAAGIIAKGSESGGRVGDQNSFILLQSILSNALFRDTPVWAQGGIGINNTAALLAAGAFGVVFDSQLSLLQESQIPSQFKSIIRKLDGGETQIVNGERCYEIKTVSPDSNIKGEPSNEAKRWFIGQDIGLAAIYEKKYKSVESFVRILTLSIEGHIEHANNIAIFNTKSAFASDQKTQYPIVQGPMTRVSDNADFAYRVAENGALPLLALSLMNQEACENVMKETQQKLNGKPWGVGVLGFADAEILNPQLELIKQYKPDRVLIAGGRPSQARQLEKIGIPTYLHVPAPSLLEMYLKDGARNFVFEGQECGGHIGPRSSFVLWEQQLEILENFDDLKQVRLLFAGGIHDALSASMLALITSSLAAKGAKVGILMGSAYLSTVEAVESQAINQEYQNQMLACHATAILETAPGHATRCIRTPFTRFFENEKLKAKESGLSSHDAWMHLENLIVGRLRIASKGIQREGGELVEVPLETQREDGMYMIGQVADLTKKKTTMKALHDSVSDEAMRFLKQSIDKVDVSFGKYYESKMANEPIAIIGMDCVYPGSKNLDEYWNTILSGDSKIQEVPQERWKHEAYYDPSIGVSGKTPSKWGGFIDDILMDPVSYGIPPNSVAAIEPIQLISLQVTKGALQDAGYWDEKVHQCHELLDKENTSVIFGAESGMDLSGAYSFRNYFEHFLGDMPKEVDEALPKLTEDSFPGVLANVISGRIANRFDFGGCNYTVDSACASSLTSVEIAVKELRTGTSNVVIAGGADFHNSINDYLMFSSVTALSPTGECRSFDNTADGIALGEGVGVVILKRLSDAQRDGDKIYALIRGIAGSSDGKSLGLTAPRKEGQQKALMRAYWRAGINPKDIELVEAHGTGTVVGDRTELKTLTEVYLSGGAKPQNTTLGSVKSQIGHTKCAAGIAGLIKITKALYHKVLPPTAKISKPNEYYDPQVSPFVFDNEARPWMSDEPKAAISAFGFGGTNFHAVLSAYNKRNQENKSQEHAWRTPSPNYWPAELFVFRGKTLDDALNVVEKTKSWLEASESFSLSDVSYSLNALSQEIVQCAITVKKNDNLLELLNFARNKAEHPSIAYRKVDIHEGKIAFLFPGQGSQRVNMLKELFIYFPELQSSLESGKPWINDLYPPTTYDAAVEEQRQKQITDTRVAQPTLAIVSSATAKLLSNMNVTPDIVAGHSFGELVALAHAGSMEEDVLFELSAKRGEAIVDAIADEAGTMLAVNASSEKIKEMLNEKDVGIQIANHNSNKQTVLTGSNEAINKADALLREKGIGTKLINVACAFHSSLIQGAESIYLETLKGSCLNQPAIPVYSNLTAEQFPDNVEDIKLMMSRQIVNPVMFRQQLQNMYEAGVRTFIEVGPGRVLSHFVKDTIESDDYICISSDTMRDSALLGFLKCVGQLSCMDTGIQIDYLFSHRKCQLVDLEQPNIPSKTSWKINGHKASPILGESPQHAGNLDNLPIHTVSTSNFTVTNHAEETVSQYLGNVREMIHAQRDVMLGLLGQPVIHQVRDNAAIEMQTTINGIKADSNYSNGVAQEPLSNNSNHSANHSFDSTALQKTLFGIISDRTGYPPELLDPELDLEADLSIDSIKRVEIISELSGVIGLKNGSEEDDRALEQLAKEKTIGGLLQFLEVLLNAPSDTHADAKSAEHQIEEQENIDVKSLVLQVVSDKTGYPTEVMELDLNLEADLSIDSIKRVEIFNDVLQSMNIHGGENKKDYVIEKLASLGTLREIVDFLQSLNGPSDNVVNESLKEQYSVESSIDKKTISLSRYVLKTIPAPKATHSINSLSGKHIAITNDHCGVAETLAERLHKVGVTTTIVNFPDIDEHDLNSIRCDGLVHLWGLNTHANVSDIKKFSSIVGGLLNKNLDVLLIAGGLGGEFGLYKQQNSTELSLVEQGSGLAGLLKSVVKEYPSLRGHWIDLNLSEPVEKLAEYIEMELLADNPLTEVSYQEGTRKLMDIVKTTLEEGGPEGSLELNTESVVLITGGARGISAELAISLAEKYGCQFELVGRSPEPSRCEEDLHLEAADKMALRKKLIAINPKLKPAQIENIIREITAEREIKQTLERLKSFGSQVRYHSMDVRDTKQFSDLIEQLYTQHGTIDAVVHAAGIIEDRLLKDKSPESFERVFDTKVQCAKVLSKHIREDVKFVVFFSSVAGVFGNRGQVDYASANDVLDKFAHSMQSRIRGRVLSINWGPWSGRGMVSPELEKDYARRGIGLIDVKEGIDALMKELQHGDKQDVQVVLMCGDPSVMNNVS